MQFFGNFGQIIGWHHCLGLVPLSEKSWVRPCLYLRTVDDDEVLVGFTRLELRLVGLRTDESHFNVRVGIQGILHRKSCI